MRHLLPIARALLRDRKAATAVEYGLILALIVLAMFVSLKGFADTAIGIWNMVAGRVTAAG